MHVTGLPNWLEADVATCSIYAPESGRGTSWTTAPYYKTDQSNRFTEVYNVTFETPSLDAENYTVTIREETFGVTMYDKIDYELS